MPAYAGFSDVDPARTRFLLVGDTQSTSRWEFWRERNETERQLVLGEIVRRRPAFAIHLGDLTTRGSSRRHWRIFDDAHRGLLEERIPCFPILGNHDLYGPDGRALRHYFERFPHLEGRRWYSFAWLRVGLVLVDSNFLALSRQESEEQAVWYRGEIERLESDPGIDSIIACCHRPPFTNSKVVGPSSRARTLFAEPFLRSRKAALFFSGHSHTYERFEVAGKHFVVSGGGGGPRHRVATSASRRRFRDSFPGPALRFFHACQVDATEGGLVCSAVRLEEDGGFAGVDTVVVPPCQRPSTGPA